MREDPLIEFDVVQHRAKTPVLNEGVARHLAVVHHTCNRTQKNTFIDMNAGLGARSVAQRSSPPQLRNHPEEKCNINVLFTSITEEIAVSSARSKGSSTFHSCLLYLKNQEEYWININIILDDRSVRSKWSPIYRKTHRKWQH